MKRILIIVTMLTMPTWLTAHPLVDLLIGAVMVGGGAGLNIEKNNLAGEKQDARNRANNHNTRKQTALNNAAIWCEKAKDLTYNRDPGYDPTYDPEFVATMQVARRFEEEAARESASARKFSDEASDKQNSEHVYKGVTIGTWVSGGTFLAKSLFCFLKQRKANKLVELAPEPKNYEIALIPSRDLSGAMAMVRWKW